MVQESLERGATGARSRSATGCRPGLSQWRKPSQASSWSRRRRTSEVPFAALIGHDRRPVQLISAGLDRGAGGDGAPRRGRQHGSDHGDRLGAARDSVIVPGSACEGRSEAARRVGGDRRERAGSGPLFGDPVVFRPKRLDRDPRCLRCDGTGLVMAHKRLEALRQRFATARCACRAPVRERCSKVSTGCLGLAGGPKPLAAA